MQQENSQLERCSKVLREVTMIGKIIRNLLHSKCRGDARKNSWGCKVSSCGVRNVNSNFINQSCF